MNYGIWSLKESSGFRPCPIVKRYITLMFLYGKVSSRKTKVLPQTCIIMSPFVRYVNIIKDFLGLFWSRNDSPNKDFPCTWHIVACAGAYLRNNVLIFYKVRTLRPPRKKGLPRAMSQSLCIMRRVMLKSFVPRMSIFSKERFLSCNKCAHSLCPTASHVGDVFGCNECAHSLCQTLPLHLPHGKGFWLRWGWL